MKYEKPEVQLLATAVSAIQDPMEKALSGFIESSTTWVSVNAYAVDE